MGEKYEDGYISAVEKSLSEKDIQLNALSSELFDVTRDLSNEAIFTINVADPESSDKPAEVNTESLAKFKLKLLLIQELISKIEFISDITSLAEAIEFSNGRIELVFPPERVNVPEGMSLSRMVSTQAFELPDVDEVDEYNAPEAYMAALQNESVIQSGVYEFTAGRIGQLPKVEGKKAIEVAAELVAQIDSNNPWRLATLTELMAFATSHPERVRHHPIVAGGETDPSHYPMCLQRTNTGIRLDMYRGGLSQEGTTILISRAGLVDVKNAAGDRDSGIDSAVEEPQSYEAKVQEFYRELEKVSESDKEELRSVVEVTQLLGHDFANLRSRLGDIVFDQIMNEVIRARIPTNTPGPDGLYRIAPEREEMCLANIERTGQIVDIDMREEVLTILRNPDLLNSDTMNLRERARVSHGILTELLTSLEVEATFPREELNELIKQRKILSSAIGNQSKLNLLHPRVD